MATIVNNPDSGGGAGGWIIAGALIVGIVLVAIFVWPGLDGGEAAPTQVNVEIPTPDMDGSAQ
jgi:hypothetical protein